ncbi:MAG: hypothetical protein ACKO3W_12570 [bacterium]
MTALPLVTVPTHAVTTADAIALRALCDRCLSCHDADGPAPLRLDSVDAVLRHRTLMRVLIDDRTMPPAGAETPLAQVETAHAARVALTIDARNALLAALASPDAVRAAFVKLAPPPPLARENEGVRLTVLSAWTVPTTGGMRVRSFSAEIPPEAPRRLRGWRLVAAADPARSPIRFLSLAPDPARVSRILDESGTGAESMGDVGLVPSGALGAISRTAPEFLLPAGYAFDLPPGDVVVESSVEPIGREALLRPSFELVAADPTDTQVVEAIAARVIPLAVAAGERCERVVHLPLARDTRLVGVIAKGGVFLRGYTVEVIAADGCRTSIARERDFRMNLAAPLVFREPPVVAAGSVVEVRFDLDNTSANPLQPFDPPRPIVAGLPPEGEDAAIVLLVSPGR